MKIIGMILLGVLCIPIVLVVLIILLLCPRLGLRILGENGQYQIWVRYGYFKLPMQRFTSKQKCEKTEKSQKTSSKEKKKSPLQRIKNLRKKMDENQLPDDALAKNKGFGMENLGELICDVLSLLSELKNTLRIDVIDVNVMLASDDAATTGMKLGAWSAVVGAITPFYYHNFHMKTYRVVLDADFNSEKTTYQAEIAISLRPIMLIYVLIRRYKDIWKYYQMFEK